MSLKPILKSKVVGEKYFLVDLNHVPIRVICGIHKTEMEKTNKVRGALHLCDMFNKAFIKLDDPTHYCCMMCKGGGLDVCKSCIKNPDLFQI